MSALRHFSSFFLNLSVFTIIKSEFSIRLKFHSDWQIRLVVAEVALKLVWKFTLILTNWFSYYSTIQQTLVWSMRRTIWQRKEGAQISRLYCTVKQQSKTNLQSSAENKVKMAESLKGKFIYSKFGRKSDKYTDSWVWNCSTFICSVNEINLKALPVI